MTEKTKDLIAEARTIAKHSAVSLPDHADCLTRLADALEAAARAAQGAAPQAEAYDHCCNHPKCPGGSLCCCVSERRLRDCWNQWREEIAGGSRQAFRDGYQAGQNDPAPWLTAPVLPSSGAPQAESEPKPRTRVVTRSFDSDCALGICMSGCSHLMWVCDSCSSEGGWGAARGQLKKWAAEHVCPVLPSSGVDEDKLAEVRREAAEKALNDAAEAIRQERPEMGMHILPTPYRDGKCHGLDLAETIVMSHAEVYRQEREE